MFSEEEIMSGKVDCATLMCRVSPMYVGMIAKYARQASIRQTSASTPTAAKSISEQFSRQKSVQAVDKSDDEEV